MISSGYIAVILGMFVGCALCQQQNNVDCQNRRFSCQNGRTIPFSWVCDNETDCADGSDELLENCQPICSSDSRFTCQNGDKIPFPWVCDNETDCADGSDELSEICKPNISSALLIDCTTQTFACSDGSTHPFSFLCDTFNDCDDGSDEITTNCVTSCSKTDTTTTIKTTTGSPAKRRRKRWLGGLFSGISFSMTRAAATHHMIGQRHKNSKNDASTMK